LAGSITWTGTEDAIVERPTVPDRTLILEIALPDYYLEDWDETVEFYPGDADTLEMIENESGLCSPRVNLTLLLGGKDGTWAERISGQIVGARVVPRENEHELSDDSRLDDYEADHAG
jgi:hypothetical protein